MKLPFILNRESRRSLLIGVTPYQLLAVGLRKRDAGNVVLDSAVEFAADDEPGIRRWLEATAESHSAWRPVAVGITSPRTLLQRHSIQPRRLAEPNYLSELCNIQAAANGEVPWKLHVLSPLEGQPLAAVPQGGGQRPALVAGLSHEEIHEVQQRMLDYRMLPYQLEISTLPLFASLYERQARSGDQRAVVVVAIAPEQTTAYILGKEGVHTPAPLHHGLTGIVQAARKELRLNEAQEVADRLHHPDEEILLRASKFLRAIGRDLKSVIDSYELTTGQPVGDIYFDHLPPSLDWIAEPLAQIVGRQRYAIDCNEWMQVVGMSAAEGMPTLGSHWFSTLSLLATYPGSAPTSGAAGDEPFKGPWRVDCRLSAELPSTDVIGRRFVANAVAVALACGAGLFALWQGYNAKLLRKELTVLTQQIEENAPAYKLYEERSREMNELTTKVDAAWQLLQSPVLTTTFLAELGRVKPDVVRIDTVAQSAEGFTVRGDVAEPSNRASQTVGSFVRVLRTDPAFATHFPRVDLIDLSRAQNGRTFTFEVQLKFEAKSDATAPR